MKSTTDVEDLAILGGTPAFEEKLHVGRPSIPNRERLNASIAAILDRGWLTNDGPCVRELEQRVASLLGVKHCVATCNGTTALQLTVRALGLTGEVIVPSFTFVATVHALTWEGITPVFCDVAADTHNLDPDRVQAAITPRTTGILGVHCWGRPCEIDRLTGIARQSNLTLLFDAAHAFRCSHAGRMIGGFGAAEVFSFHATKFFHTLEGGAVTTNDDGLAARLRLMRNFGFAGFDRVIELGINGKMNELSAAVGLSLLENVDDVMAVNHRHYNHYAVALTGIAGLRLMVFDERETSNRQYIVIDVDSEVAGLSRDELIRILWAENVIARRYFYPGCHRATPYGSPSDRDPRLAETERLAERVLCLPTGMAVGPDAIDEICRILRLAIANGPAVRARLAMTDRRGSANIPE